VDAIPNTLRKSEKRIERSDSAFLTEEKAFEEATRAIEVDMKPSSGGQPYRLDLNSFRDCAILGIR
jgi:hypothetical protein